MISLSRFRHAFVAFAAIYCLSSAVPGAYAQINQFLTSTNQQNFSFGAFDEGAVPLLVEDDFERIGSTPAKVVIDSVVAFPLSGKKDQIVLRNIGGKPANISGWKIMDNGDDLTFVLKTSEDCPEFNGIENFQPAEKLVIEAESVDAPCGFSFDLGIKDEVRLLSAGNKLMASVAWDDTEEGSVIKRIQNGKYVAVSQNEKVLDVLRDLGNFTMFLEALKVTGLADDLKAVWDPDFPGPFLPTAAPPPEVIPQFPSHFGFTFNRSALPPPPPPPAPPAPPKAGVPKKGPYTILAPTDDAFESLRVVLGGSGNPPFSKKELLNLPELKDILLYHILGGNYTTEILLNNTGIFTSRTAEVTPFQDPIITEGKVMLHDSCVDKPTPDTYDCKEQKEFGKCFDPFMTSPLAAQWRGGFCERTCERCNCDFGFCATVDVPDVFASNGVIHVIDRVMFPPPIFKKEEIAPEAESPMDAEFEAALEDAQDKPMITIGFKPSTSKDEEVSETGR